ncbi:MAG: hypothetical protein LC785_07125 [Acidobacteria bacterium]|nr:hypothetical protein [Acidobacteriota bacterium]MCA1641709.1 hypothetical protein [Acidobacteriota bacterium]
MRQNILRERRNISWFALLLAPALSLILLASSGGRGSAAPAAAPAPAAAAMQVMRPWTAIGSTGAVDENSRNLYASFSTEIGFQPGVNGNVIVARYNVTNTFDNNANPNQPGWHTLEMGSNAPANVIIDAKLFQVKACQPAQELLCTARNRSNDMPCARCTFNGPIDFTSNLYYVEVTLDRTGAPAALPRMFTLRVF